MFQFLRRKPPIGSSAALANFLDRQASFMVQKCIYEYARARSGVLSSKLFKEDSFKAAVEAASWRNYPICLQNAAVMVEHTLRDPAGSAAGDMRNGLAAAVAIVCRRYPVPRGFEDEFWTVAQARIAQRIHQVGLAPPRRVKDIPQDSSRLFFAGLPIHPDLRSFDFELVTNNLRVNLCRAYEDFIAAADLPAVTRALIAAGERESEVEQR